MCYPFADALPQLVSAAHSRFVLLRYKDSAGIEELTVAIQYDGKEYSALVIDKDTKWPWIVYDFVHDADGTRAKSAFDKLASEVGVVLRDWKRADNDYTADPDSDELFRTTFEKIEGNLKQTVQVVLTPPKRKSWFDVSIRVNSSGPTENE